MSSCPLSSAGRSSIRGLIHFLALSLLIAHATGMPMLVRRSHMHYLHARGQHEAASSSQAESASSHEEGDSVFSPKNSFFPVMVIAITASAIAVLASLCLYTYWLWKKKRSAGDAETRAGSLSEKLSTLDPDDSTLPRPQPVASSVARGSSTRFKILHEWQTPFHAAGDFHDDTAYPTHASRPAKSQRDSVFSDFASTFSLDSKADTESTCLRQTDLSQPCVTRGSPEWIIHAYADTNEADDSYAR